MDDVLRIIESSEVDSTLNRINKLHDNLKFTVEKESEEGCISFLDMKLIHKKDGTIESSWFRKETDTGLLLNFNSMAPNKYKRSIVANIVHRIFNSTSTWKLFHDGLQAAKQILSLNQYPENWYEPIIHKTLEKILTKESKMDANVEEEKVEKHMFFIEYRGKITDNFARKLYETNTPVKVIMTLTKTKMVLPSLKPKIDRVISSNVVYKYSCPHCKMSYVGYTCRHLKTRISEHLHNKGELGPIKKHAEVCSYKNPNSNDFMILKKVNGDMTKVSIMEALFIREIKPELNTRDEYRSRMLRIKI